MTEQMMPTTVGNTLNGETQPGILSRLARLLAPSVPRRVAPLSVRARMRQARNSLDAAAAALDGRAGERGQAI